jgi:hypothetical protein
MVCLVARLNEKLSYCFGHELHCRSRHALFDALISHCYNACCISEVELVTIKHFKKCVKTFFHAFIARINSYIVINIC